MTRFFMNFLFFLIFTNQSLADCAMQNDLVAAEYEVTSTQSGNEAQKIRHFILWRNGRQVAHEYPDTHITDLWEQTSNGRLHLVRYFDNHQRGIEYQPNEIEIGREKHDWILKNQLISKNLIKAMKLQTTRGEDCNKIENYYLKKDEKTITLEWLEQQLLVGCCKSFDRLECR